MRTKSLMPAILGMVLLISAPVQSGSQDPDRTSTGLTARELLEKADRVRNGGPSVVVRTQITHYKNGQIEQDSLLEIFAKGPEKVLVKSLDPRSRGLRVLLLGDDMWISLPDVSRPVRITPAQRLVGQASNGDVARTYYAVDYEARLVKEESVGDKKCALLELKARRRGATYQKIDYWVDLKSNAPVQANFFLTSGKHSKFAVFEDFASFGGHLLVRQVTIHDRVQGKEKTTIRYLDLQEKEIPDRYYNTSRMREF
jgi:hypothetical protein